MQYKITRPLNTNGCCFPFTVNSYIFIPNCYSNIVITGWPPNVFNKNQPL